MTYLLAIICLLEAIAALGKIDEANEATKLEIDQ